MPGRTGRTTGWPGYIYIYIKSAWAFATNEILKGHFSGLLLSFSIKSNKLKFMHKTWLDVKYRTANSAMVFLCVVLCVSYVVCPGPMGLGGPQL